MTIFPLETHASYVDVGDTMAIAFQGTPSEPAIPTINCEQVRWTDVRPGLPPAYFEGELDSSGTHLSGFATGMIFGRLDFELSMVESACPGFFGDDFRGTWSSNALGLSGTWLAALDIDVVDGTISGSVAVYNGQVAAGGSVFGTIDCERISFQTLDGGMRFTGYAGDNAIGGTFSYPGVDSASWQGDAFEPPQVRGGAAAIVEGDDGTVVAHVPIHLTSPSSHEVAVAWETIDTLPAPSAGLDYEPAAGTATFQPGQTSVTVPVVVHGDLIDEDVYWNAEWGGLRLSGATGASIQQDLALFLIADDDEPPTLQPVHGGVVEGNEGQTTAFMRVRLSAPSGRSVSVDYRTLDALSQPQPGIDYVPTSGRIHFEPGQTEAVVEVKVLGDTEDEEGQLWGAEWGGLVLEDPVNAHLGPGLLDETALLLIVDDD
jgi:hypothetical protein